MGIDEYKMLLESARMGFISSSGQLEDTTIVQKME